MTRTATCGCREFYHPRLPGGTDPDLSQPKGCRTG